MTAALENEALRERAEMLAKRCNAYSKRNGELANEAQRLRVELATALTRVALMEDLRAQLAAALAGKEAAEKRADWWRDRCIESDCRGLALEDGMREVVDLLTEPRDEVDVFSGLDKARALLEDQT